MNINRQSIIIPSPTPHQQSQSTQSAPVTFDTMTITPGKVSALEQQHIEQAMKKSMEMFKQNKKLSNRSLNLNVQSKPSPKFPIHFLIFL